MTECKNIKPNYGELYYSIDKDKNLISKIYIYDKEDLFNIMHSLCWDSPLISDEDIEDAVKIINLSLKINKGE